MLTENISEVFVIGDEKALELVRQILAPFKWSASPLVFVKDESGKVSEQATPCILFHSCDFVEPESLEMFSRAFPLIVISPEEANIQKQAHLVRSGAHEFLTGNGLSSTALHDAIIRATVRFNGLQEDYRREKMFNRLCDALPFQMAYRIIVPPGEKARFVYVSEGVHHISGLNREDVLDDPDILYRQILAEDRERLREAESEAVRTLTPLEIEVRKKDASGNLRWVHIRSYPEMQSDGAIVWDGIESNITSYKEAEQSVTDLLGKNQRLLESERQARLESEKNGRMKDEFLATLSHELRTPINAVLGWAQLIKQGRLSEEQSKKAIDTVERNAKAQAQLIADLLDMNRIVSGKLQLQIEIIDIRQMILSAIESIRPVADAKKISINFDMDCEVDFAINGDNSRLQQVLWNLLANAVKFTPDNGEIRIKISEESQQVVIAVKDSGIGIKKEFLPFVFDRFRQADATFARKFGGLGLGLSIVKQILLLHSGSIRVDSDGEGKGATFTVKLRKAKAQTSTFSAWPEAPGLDNHYSESLKNIKILLIDDEADSLDLTSHLLAQAGASVTVTRSADQALEKIKSSSSEFDVIVSDIGMPDKDGLEFIREAHKRIPGTKKIPAVALTAFARPEDRDRALEAGFRAHITKPVDSDKLILVVRGLLS